MNLPAAVALANALVTIVILSGTGYAVFVLDRSPWWFLAAVAVDLAVSQYVKTKTA